MFIVMNLYQNGDIEIVQKETQWSDKIQETFFNQNFFQIIKNEDTYGIVDLYSKYEDVISKFNTLRRNNHDGWVTQGEARGQIMESVILLDIDSREIKGSVFLGDKFERKTLESNLQSIMEKLTEKAKAYKEEMHQKFEEMIKGIKF